ncbi:predicted protein [Naegleria gruberi]|uniref:Predicted protein n=1 Tax=Naegleria gruberi TaxID=5762 RepID=D2VT98_NAEGR|nr:uncharacterized protein NAEGRDRAFT_72224 [Naegleria gruberi]EFC39896.1 predicted protein [Naegleria gruberi]|eukprot:XP_002672640.1 predicted protein [Naegleria gruberi strain NEG-M]
MGNKFNKATSRKEKKTLNSSISNTTTTNTNNNNNNTTNYYDIVIEHKVHHKHHNSKHHYHHYDMSTEHEHTIEEEGLTEITEFDITPQTPPTPTLLYPHPYESSHSNTLTLSHSNNTLSDYEDSIQDSNLFHSSIVYLKNSYSNQQYL